MRSLPAVEADAVGWLTEAQMVEVDRIMIDELRIGLVQMMENAGRHLAQLVIERFEPATVTVLAGAGGNGGGGLVAARHLANRGVDVSVTVARPADELAPVTAHQFDILQRMGLDVATDPASDPRCADVVVDALIGYSLHGPPRGRVGELIAGAADVGERVVSLDTPSGLDVTTGTVPGVVVHADATVTLALPKIGLRHAPEVGELHLADISVPKSVPDAIGVGPAPDFSRSCIVEIVNR